VRFGNLTLSVLLGSVVTIGILLILGVSGDVLVSPDTPQGLDLHTLPPPTPVVWFHLDHNPVSAGECAFVRWDTSGALEVYLDEELVSSIGSSEVCPTGGTEYTLQVVSESGERSETLVLGVIDAGTQNLPTLELTVTSEPGGAWTRYRPVRRQSQRAQLHQRQRPPRVCADRGPFGDSISCLYAGGISSPGCSGGYCDSYGSTASSHA